MRCFLCLLLLAFCGGCSVNVSLFVEKDWKTESTDPDLKTRVQVELWNNERKQ